MMFEYTLRVYLNMGLFFYIGELFKFLYEYPIYPRCRDIMEREKRTPCWWWM
jgi:hypothetical protein